MKMMPCYYDMYRGYLLIFTILKFQITQIKEVCERFSELLMKTKMIKIVSPSKARKPTRHTPKNALYTAYNQKPLSITGRV